MSEAAKWWGKFCHFTGPADSQRPNSGQWGAAQAFQRSGEGVILETDAEWGLLQLH